MLVLEICSLGTCFRLASMGIFTINRLRYRSILSSVLSHLCPRYLFGEQIVLSHPCPRYGLILPYIYIYI